MAEGAPQAGDDLELLLEPVEAFAERRERDAVGGVLGLEPAGAQPELHPAARHLVDLRHRDGQWPGQPEGRRGDQGAEPDPGRLAGQAAEGHVGVGRPRLTRAGHGQEVVGAEEGVEAAVLGGPRHPEQVVVARPLLGLGEDPEVHRVEASHSRGAGTDLAA